MLITRENTQGNYRPEAIELQLIKIVEGEAFDSSETVSEENNWTYRWTELDRNADGESIDYTIEEVIDEEYGSYEVNIIITNTRAYETEHKVVKGSNDDENQDGNRLGSVLVQLLANGENQDEAVEVTAENNWIHTWTGLALNSEGTAVKYTVEELEFPEGYEASINNENPGNLVIANSYITKEPTEPVKPDEDRESEDTD